ncbi:SDR family oxidoreductase [Parendozoicomonas haliclonae]|uniref:3-oxoacyl-[acyl-carrier-protein] reductase FabG n=1 Tax=Parendozoicomonas haliclonae TaxID=1960125 RepID=A0A1X7AQE3_9GAMM|nr:SDR family oxidoreductase [Parendozoicomonas haliclonae]SMA50330.1 3-oxoacyl-[acyl-carrier-protein] reductase FabG [Parendozoicomonas haliclonae]
MPKTVLITGCSTGIGQALALELHQRGYQVWASARKLEAVQNLKSQSIQTLALDVTDEGSRKAALAEIQQTSGQLDILINNAGYGAMGPVIESPESALRQQFETNTFAPISLIQDAFPLLKASQSAIVVNVTSVSGILTTPFSGMYCASKAAFSTLTEALRMELMPFGIEVIDVQPGAIRSSFADNASKTLDILPKNSVYQKIEQAIQARARASQDKPSSAEGLAIKIAEALDKKGKPRLLRYGNGSAGLPFLANWLPRKLVHRILQKKFQLDQL